MKACRIIDTQFPPAFGLQGLFFYSWTAPSAWRMRALSRFHCRRSSRIVRAIPIWKVSGETECTLPRLRRNGRRHSQRCQRRASFGAMLRKTQLITQPMETARNVKPSGTAVGFTFLLAIHSFHCSLNVNVGSSFKDASNLKVYVRLTSRHYQARKKSYLENF